MYTPNANRIDFQNRYVFFNCRKEERKRKYPVIVYITFKKCDSNHCFFHYFSIAHFLDAYISFVKQLILHSKRSFFTSAMTVSDSPKNIKLGVIKITSIEEEVSIKPVEYGPSDDPDDRKLLRKLDLHLIPTMTLLYLLSYLDRVNIGQAKIDGLTDSLHLTSAQYNACLSIFFATYVAFEIPSNLVLKKLRPSRWIPMIMIAWGIVMSLMGLVHSYGGLLACRLVLGAAESGLFPGK